MRSRPWTRSWPAFKTAQGVLACRPSAPQPGSAACETHSRASQWAIPTRRTGATRSRTRGSPRGRGRWTRWRVLAPSRLPRIRSRWVQDRDHGISESSTDGCAMPKMKMSIQFNIAEETFGWAIHIVEYYSKRTWCMKKNGESVEAWVRTLPIVDPWLLLSFDFSFL